MIKALKKALQESKEKEGGRGHGEAGAAKPRISKAYEPNSNPPEIAAAPYKARKVNAHRWPVLLVTGLLTALVATGVLFFRDTPEKSSTSSTATTATTGQAKTVDQVADEHGAVPNRGAPGLVFQGVRYGWTNEGGQMVLEVQGDVVNNSGAKVEVPIVVIALLDESGEEISEWTTEVSETELDAAEQAPFLRQIPSPPSNVRSVKVRFAKGPTTTATTGQAKTVGQVADEYGGYGMLSSPFVSERDFSGESVPSLFDLTKPPDPKD